MQESNKNDLPVSLAGTSLSSRKCEIERWVESAFQFTWDRGIFGVRVTVNGQFAYVKIYLFNELFKEEVDQALQRLVSTLSNGYQVHTQMVQGMVPCQKILVEVS